jgi:uncharacterized OB-fold protein
VELMHPALVGLFRSDTGAVEVVLRGGICRDCSRRFFPAQAYGCERCGSIHLEGVMLPGTGTVAAKAQVHIHKGAPPVAALTVAMIDLDEGPSVRGLLAEVPHAPRTGERVKAVLVPVANADGADCLDLRFAAQD